MDHRISPLLVTIFRKIERENMQGIPILNHALNVEALGFNAWEEYQLGILITPWFMNLMLIPNEAFTLADTCCGDKRTLHFPAGDREFIVNELDELGHYLSCALYSPMFSFANQEDAVATASDYLLQLMDSNNLVELSEDEQQIGRFMRGEISEFTKPEPEPETVVTLEERIQQPISRRELLRGAFKGGSTEDS
jgi:[NiFe] hydrogenase assembly HybE family chaperone